MTYLPSAPSAFDGAFLAPRHGWHGHPTQLAAGRRRKEIASALVLGIATTVFRSWRQAVESRRARLHLAQLDDHLLKDIGLVRPDLHYGDFETIGRHRRLGGFR